MDIFMRQPNDVTDIDTVYLPVAGKSMHDTFERETEVVPVLFQPPRDTLQEIFTTPIPEVMATSPTSLERSSYTLKHQRDSYAQSIALDIVVDKVYSYAIQTICPTRNVRDTLITIEYLCDLFLARRKALPLEISLHWLACLEMLASGHSCFSYTFSDQRKASSYLAGDVVEIPFFARPMENENMIIVRGG
ncbi:hypothetical protein KDA_63230 [Dictyobacter alpinus]|uniref:Uncharacterized protein n=1 Tax=Dictyobacter alpinus TaxID=2014873 RepID=A0A402BHN8_9CHLR|nr:hypothetical protein [Dictyobacter alpinus]GCE30839.1 hypothetical protein KDA_63230 [Dictyobacter alpinus]